jgi:two-component system, NarL family, response regulator NreC
MNTDGDTSQTTVRILIADDHQMFRDGLRQLLEQHGEFEVVGDVADGREAGRLALELKPHVVVMDVTMPVLNGVEATRQIKACCPGVRVIGVSMHADCQFVTETIAAGASGYLLKDGPARELENAVRAVMAGEVYLSPKVAGIILRGAGSAARGHFGVLTPREREILQLVADGRSCKEIAQMLHLSAKTVDTHRRQVMNKLNLDSVAELTHYAIRQGVTPLH